MAARNWLIEGRYVEYCSCDPGCPCESMADPTYGYCTGLVAFKIDNGYCEQVRLDDLAVVGTFYFPRAIHHGQGVFQPILDERADEAQRDALFYILSGEDQPVGTMFQIFSVIIETIKDPLFAKIDFEWDLDKRRARIEVADVVRAHSEPIRNPVTDAGAPDDHRPAGRLGVPRGGKRVRLCQRRRDHQVRPEPAAQLAGTHRLEPEWPGPHL